MTLNKEISIDFNKILVSCLTKQNLTGIYCIENLINNKLYIGSSATNLINRFKSHLNQLNKNKHDNVKLQNSWNKHGKDSFKISVLEFCEPDKCIEREQYYIDTLNPFYNICRTAGNCKGRKFSKATIKKMSENMKIRGLPEGLVKQQISPFPNDIGNERYCNKCNIFKNKLDFAIFKQGRRRTCKSCIKKLYPHKKKTRLKFKEKLNKGIKVLAINNNIQITFFSLRDAEKYFKKQYPEFNRTHLKNMSLKKEIYYGFYWEILCP